MFNKDFILHKKGVIPQEDCDCLINYFESNEHLHDTGTVSRDGEVLSMPELKKDTEIFCKFPLFNWVNDYIEECVCEYREEHPVIDECAAWSLWPSYKIQRYFPGEAYFKLHYENTGPFAGEEPLSRRILAWMIYLNDVTEGGHTEFPYQSREIQPRRGDILIWPAYFTHPHRGIPSMTQTKYIVTGWYCFRKIKFD